MHKLYILLFLLLPIGSRAQESLTLDWVLQTAKQQSLDAFRAQNTYLISHWEYKMYEAERKPWLSMDLTPIQYDRSLTERYNSELNIDEYRSQQTLSNTGYLTLSQNITATGGLVYLYSGLSRLENFGEYDYTSFSATMLRMGVSQPIGGFNEFKWEKKIAPEQYEMAKQELIEEFETINVYAVTYFFDLTTAMDANKQKQTNLKDAKEMLLIGQRRYKISAITKDDLVQLELDVYNAEIELAKANKTLQKSQFQLEAFLGVAKQEQWQPVLPQVQKNLQVDVQKAVAKAFEYNPSMQLLDINTIEAEKELDQAKKENGFQSTLSLSYGLNQQGSKLSEAYKNPMDEQQVGLSMNIPIVDWGNRRGSIKKARSNQEVVRIEAMQEKQNFEQEVTLAVIDLNLQNKIIENCQRAKEAAVNAYQLTKESFRQGNTELLNLQTARQNRESAQETLTESVKDFWMYYYQLRKLTLYDFEFNQPLTQNFERIVEGK